MTDAAGPGGTLEDRVAELEGTVAHLSQQIRYLQGRNHKLEGIVAASAALLTSVSEGLLGEEPLRSEESDETAGSAGPPS